MFVFCHAFAPFSRARCETIVAVDEGAELDEPDFRSVGLAAVPAAHRAPRQFDHGFRTVDERQHRDDESRADAGRTKAIERHELGVEIIDHVPGRRPGVAVGLHWLKHRVRLQGEKTHLTHL
jgi:hypothetical protein